MKNTDPTPTTEARAGQLVLTLWPDSPLGEHQRYAYRIQDTATARSVSGRDLFTGPGAPVPPDRAVRDLAAFLTAAGEAHQHTIDHPGDRPEHEGLFPEWVAEAARRNADELELLIENGLLGTNDPRRAEQDGSDKSRSASDVSWFDRPPNGPAHQGRGPSL